MAELLKELDIEQTMHELPALHRRAPEALGIRLKLSGFPAAVALVDEVATAAEELQHHPDIDIRYDTVAFVLSTHSEGGITSLDVELARRIIALGEEADAEVLPAPPEAHNTYA